MLSRKWDSMTDRDGETPARRDGRGRYLRGASGNPAGKPRGCLNHATRIAAEMLGGEAETLWRVEINRALAGNNVLLMHCTDRIIGPRRGQPVAFAMPPIENAGDLAAAMGAVLRAAARGLITPAEAESLARTAEAGAHAIKVGERIGRERLAEERDAVERRCELAVCALLFYMAREIDEEAGDLDYRLRALCKPVLRLGRSALDTLAAIPYTLEMIEADRAFIAAHPRRLDREPSPLGAEMGSCAEKLSDYIDDNAHRREQLIEEREAAGKEPVLRYRTGLFERLLGLPWPSQIPGTGECPSPNGEEAQAGDRQVAGYAT